MDVKNLLNILYESRRASLGHVNTTKVFRISLSRQANG